MSFKTIAWSNIIEFKSHLIQQLTVSTEWVERMVYRDLNSEEWYNYKHVGEKHAVSFN